MEETKPIALIDMDGTLADFEQAMNTALISMRSPHEPQVLYARDDDPPYIRTRRKYIKNLPGFWLGLPPLQQGFQIVDLLASFDFELHILTKAPSNTPAAASEKIQWCLKYIPEALITISDKKSLVYGKILVDDWPEYIDAWLKYRPRGTVIMPAHPYNEHYSHPNVLRYDGDLVMLEQIEKAVMAIRGEYKNG